jgi:hypothetical protein
MLRSLKRINIIRKLLFQCPIKSVANDVLTLLERALRYMRSPSQCTIVSLHVHVAQIFIGVEHYKPIKRRITQCHSRPPKHHATDNLTKVI